MSVSCKKINKEDIAYKYLWEMICEKDRKVGDLLPAERMIKKSRLRLRRLALSDAKMKLIFCPLLLIACLCKGHAYTFTSTEGAKFDGEILRVRNDSVTVKRASDNREFTLNKSRFSSEDQQYFEAWAETNRDLIVYSEVPGLEASEHYTLSVKTAESSDDWQKAFAFITRCKDGERGKNNYFEGQSGWTNTYINFEMNRPVVVEIAKANGDTIRSAVAHPRRKVSACELKDGKAYVTITEPCQIAVDIDGQMDEQDTGMGYKGPPIHTVTVFANPFLKDRPKINGAGIRVVRPGERPPHDGPWETLYFLPGVHDIGARFPLHANRNYYIPGDAIVYGTMNNQDQWEDGNNIRIYGYGTLSGARLPAPGFASLPKENFKEYTPIRIVGAANTSVEGITIADSAYHSLMLVMSYQPDKPTDMRWLKIFTWRGNGDGINPFGNGLIEDCFIRTQDDSTYVNGRGIRRVTYWNDSNGSTFVLSALQRANKSLIVEDCDVIYARAAWHHWSGGRLFNMRGEGGGDCGEGVIFRNIRVHDPRPTLQHFMILMQGLQPYSDPEERLREAGDFAGVLFQDIEIAAPSVLGEPEILWGAPQAQIRNVTFDNVRIGGKKIDSLDHFEYNSYVSEITFR